MSEVFQDSTVPVDSLSVSRRVRTNSADAVFDALQQILVPYDAVNLFEQVSLIPNISAAVVEPSDFVEAKLQDKRLGLWSADKLAERYNLQLKSDRCYLDKFVRGVAVDGASYDMGEGSFALGITPEAPFIERMEGERTLAIRKLLNLAGVGPTDPIREWGESTQEAELWLPVATIWTPDPAIEEIADEVAGRLGNGVGELELDFYDNKARSVICDYDLPN